jgi:hypothetical protein
MVRSQNHDHGRKLETTEDLRRTATRVYETCVWNDDGSRGDDRCVHVAKIRPYHII